MGGIVRLPGERVGGEHDVIHGDPCGGEPLAALADPDDIAAVAIGPHQLEVSRHGAELIGNQLLGDEFIVLRIKEFRGELHARAHLVFVVAAIEYGLEMHGLARVEDGPVSNEGAVVHIAPGGLLIVVPAGKAHLPAQPQAAVRSPAGSLDNVAPSFRLGCNDLGQAGESVHHDVAGPGNHLAGNVVDHEVAALQRLSREVIRHVRRKALGVVPGRKGKSINPIIR